MNDLYAARDIINERGEDGYMDAVLLIGPDKVDEILAIYLAKERHEDPDDPEIRKYVARVRCNNGIL